MSYDVVFGRDVESALARDEYEIVEITRAPVSWHVEGAPRRPRRIRHDGTRLVLPLGPEHTADGTYSTTEVASSPRFDQARLDAMLARGSPRVVVPGREAVFRDVVVSPHFIDGRAAGETVTAGVTFQSWRGLESRDGRPAYVGVSVVYLGGSGLVPALFNRSPRRRGFVASVVDFNTGLLWSRPLPDLDLTEPHDLVLRWWPDRDVEFLVDGRVVARYADGRVQVSALKLYRRFGRGIDLVGHRRLTADPCHVDAWVNCSATGSTPDVFTGRRLSHELEVALAGFAIRPIG